jgi:hypothetical protein
LNAICKSYERNKKTEKEKRRKEEKYIKRTPGKPLGPITESAHGPSANPEPVLSCFPSPSLTLGPAGQGQVVFNLWPSISPETAAVTPPLIPFTPRIT